MSSSAREVDDARAYGATLVTAYEVHAAGIAPVIEHVPAGAPCYLTIDADAIDVPPTILSLLASRVERRRALVLEPSVLDSSEDAESIESERWSPAAVASASRHGPGG